MAQKFVQSSDFAYQVEAAPSFMQLPNGQFVKDGFTVNRRTDDYTVVGKVTDRYGIVQNTDLIGAAEDAFKAHGMKDFTRRVTVAGNGERLYAVYDFKNVTKKLAVGDEIGLRLTVQNSFDGSLRASFLAGILRLLCLNGATTLEREVGMTKKHGSNVSVDFIKDALKKAVAAWEKSTVVFDRLASVAITQEQGNAILTNLQATKVLSGKLRENINGIWTNPTHTEDAGRNLWNLYNAVTQHMTHDVANERAELADRVNRNVLVSLNRATRSNADLLKLVTVTAAPSGVDLN